MSPWLVLPAVGALAGLFASWAALLLLVKELLPRRQQAIAAGVGKEVAKNISVDDLLAHLDGIDFEPHLAAVVDAVIAAKVEDFRKIPLVGGFITAERLGGIRNAIVRKLVESQPRIVQEITRVAREKVDLETLIAARLANADMDRIGRAVNRMARCPVLCWGAALGLVIGIAQAAIVQWAL
jgi:uncharacterized membrane protein YheB (UPF0754 family)